MRQEHTVQGSIFDLFAEHEIGRELEAMSQWLDAHCDLLKLVTSDLRRHGVTATGREGLPSEAVLRCGLLKPDWSWVPQTSLGLFADAAGGRVEKRCR
jgi:IS5 family transposase